MQCRSLGPASPHSEGDWSDATTQCRQPLKLTMRHHDRMPGGATTSCSLCLGLCISCDTSIA
eukprot:2008208-Amphidinium_carterae.1